MTNYKTINYHFTRVCNYTCEFCFFTQKNNSRLTLEESKECIKKLKEFSIEKINFAGGEPFVYANDLGEMVKYAKEVGMATSIITNGSLVTREWFEKYGYYLDMLGISCDSFNEETNYKIGRVQRNKKQATQTEIAKFCFELAREYNCITKINTVVCKYNFKEDMNELISELKPDRWKVFQVLYVPNENGEYNQDSKKERRAKDLLITKEEYYEFIEKHSNQSNIVLEESETMENGYLMVDEKMRFIYSDEEKHKITTMSILEKEIHELIHEVNYSQENFEKRKGEFAWVK